ncbi:MAG: 3-oxoacyl-ACP synthase [Nannocystis sp.]|nr:hypothetical protein [Nannocystis sp.]MBA3548086.1 3-oxoacyl-ACP synthase [Nannocystis sp.]
MHAGTKRFVETQIELAPDEPLRACLLPLLPPHLDRTERVIGLGVTALTDVLAEIEKPLAPCLPLVLALPADEDGGSLDVPAIVHALENESPQSMRLEVAKGGIIRGGRASFFTALAHAENLLRSRAAPWVLIGALDSLCDLVSLADLARTNRALGADNIDGLLPGEGAAFILLAGHPPRRVAYPVYGRIIASATGREPRPYQERESPSLAAGLTHVLTCLRELAGLGEERVEYALSCQPGAVFWTRELVQAYLRHTTLFPEPFLVTSINESLGDAGAASGALLVARALWATKAAGDRRPETLRTLVYGCSNAGEVGACVVETIPV